MRNHESSAAQRRGFTLVEVLITVAVIGILAGIAIPTFLRYQLRSKTSEVKTNLSAIRISEESYFSGTGVYVSAVPEPPVIPGSDATAFDDVNTAFAELGWGPEGNVYFSYGVAVTADRTGYTADAGGDIDGDGFVQFWGFVHPDQNGVRVAGQVGCDETVPPPSAVAACDVESGRTVF